ncbi:MAG: VPLPA-CTERM sorting domain-containing protein [Pseudomonadota bacterium]
MSRFLAAGVAALALAVSSTATAQFFDPGDREFPGGLIGPIIGFPDIDLQPGEVFFTIDLVTLDQDAEGEFVGPPFVDAFGFFTAIDGGGLISGPADGVLDITELTRFNLTVVEPFFELVNFEQELDVLPFNDLEEICCELQPIFELASFDVFEVDSFEFNLNDGNNLFDDENEGFTLSGSGRGEIMRLTSSDLVTSNAAVGQSFETDGTGSSFTDPELGSFSTSSQTSVTNVGTVPLPASAWLLIAGLGGLGALRARRRA